MERIIIGLTGDSAKGKGGVSLVLKEKGFEIFVLSDVIKEEAIKRKWRHEERKVLQDLGDELRSTYGNDILVARVLQSEKFKMADFAVIDGIRHPDEIKLLKDIFEDSKLIGVDMSDETAFARMKERNRPGDPKTFEEYLLSKERERGEPGSSAMQVDVCLKLADLTIWNEGNEDDLKLRTEEGLRKFGIEISTVGGERHRHRHEFDI